MNSVRIVILLAGLFGSSFLQAAPVTLKCTDVGGTPVADLTVDLARNRIWWGAGQYRIAHVSDRYISAYLEQPGTVGGEVWVLDRVTGNYKRGSVAMLMSLEEAREGGKGRLTATTYEGRCVAPIF